MPRLVPISNPETPALFALRRTLWQLAILGIATAVTLARITPQFDLFALWCVLVPLSALAMHFRQALFNLLQLHRDARRWIVPHRKLRPQARRAYNDGSSKKRRPWRARLQRDPPRMRPLAR